MAARGSERRPPADPPTPAHAQDVVTAVVESFGGLDAVVANAGVGLGGAAAQVDDDRPS